MLKILALFLFFAFRKKEKPQQSDSSGYVPLWGWIFVSAIATLGIILVVQKKRTAKRLPAEQPQVAFSPPPAAHQSPPAPPEEPAQPTSEPPPEPDNLTKISGIGPKIQQALNEEGIYTYQQLAATSLEDLQALLKRRKWHMSTYTTWPEQAQELAQGAKG